METNQIQISVIMSIYNEPVTYVKKAIKSIQEQTFSKFEFVIVLDKPDYKKMNEFLDSKAKQDSRIVLINNSENIGLAASLNRGANIAKGEYIARMDADDISKPDRLRQELAYLKLNNYDMVSCLADKIDEKGRIWDVIEAGPSSEKYINEVLPIQNIIIHPTILMKKSVFKNLGGYRMFPSCQDYDLWLRMLTNGYRIGILNENLFYFRRHKNSISSSQHYGQVLNEKYIRKLYKERIKRVGEDEYSLENLEHYLYSHGADNERKKVYERRCFNEYQKALELMKSHQLIRGLCMILISIPAYTVRESIKTSLKAHRVKRKYINS